jgi:transposase-like protein
MRYIELKESEKSILKEKMRSRISFREQQRIHCIILSSKKYKIGELSDIFEVDRDTIARWLDWWEEDGQAGLKDAVKRGRPCILLFIVAVWLKLALKAKVIMIGFINFLCEYLQ